MMHGHEKSDLVRVAVKRTKKEVVSLRRRLEGRSQRSLVERRAGEGEYAPAKHVLDLEPGSRVTGAGAYTANSCRHTPEGAVCGKAARTDSGRGVP